MKTYSLAFLGRARRRRSHTAKFKLEAMRDFGKDRSNGVYLTRWRQLSWFEKDWEMIRHRVCTFG
jgi:hypothetical protein